MKKIILFILSFIAIIGGIVGSLYMMSKNQPPKKEGQSENYYIADKVTDECTEEFNELEIGETEETYSSETEKISPKAIIEFEKFYMGCEHTQSRYEEVPANLVNATKKI